MIPDDKLPLVTKIVDNICYLEEQLEKVKNLPFIQVEKGNRYKQKTLPAGKLYVSLNQQYQLAIKTLNSLLDDRTEDDSSPLQAYLKSLMNND